MSKRKKFEDLAPSYTPQEAITQIYGREKTGDPGPVEDAEDGYPACPRCGCAPGTYGRLLRTKEGEIICNDCQVHIFERAPP